MMIANDVATKLLAQLPTAMMLILVDDEQRPRLCWLTAQAKALLNFDENAPCENWYDWPTWLSPLTGACKNACQKRTPVHRAEVSMLHPKLGERVYGFSIRPLEGTPYWLTSFNDITLVKNQETEALKLKDELLQSKKLAAMGTLIATIGHEVKLPLVGIGMNVELAQMSLKSLKANAPQNDETLKWISKADEALNRATHAIQNGASMLKELLDYARPARLAEQPVDLISLIRRAAVAVADGTLDWHRVTFELDTPPYEPLRVMADPAKLEHVFQNLFRNALEATAQPVTLRVTFNPPRANSPQAGKETQAIVIRVADNGPGIPDELHERVFEPFFSTKAGKGTGLGLSTCYRMVEEHGGMLSLVPSNELESGTAFDMQLPLVALTEEEPPLP
ncbi:MAG: ATP-binding protein [Vampirovibrionales bacterium]|nr:ATP-binding protein [Vampirovibrionales bacterium]